MAISQKKLAYPYEFFNKIDDYRNPVVNLKQEHLFSKLKTKCPKGGEIARTKEINKLFDIKNGEDLFKLFCKSDV